MTSSSQTSAGPPLRQAPCTLPIPHGRRSPDPDGEVLRHVIAAVVFLYPKMKLAKKKLLVKIIDYDVSRHSVQRHESVVAPVSIQLSRIAESLVTFELQFPQFFMESTP